VKKYIILDDKNINDFCQEGDEFVWKDCLESYGENVNFSWSEVSKIYSGMTIKEYFGGEILFSQAVYRRPVTKRKIG